MSCFHIDSFVKFFALSIQIYTIIDATHKIADMASLTFQRLCIISSTRFLHNSVIIAVNSGITLVAELSCAFLKHL